MRSSILTQLARRRKLPSQITLLTPSAISTPLGIAHFPMSIWVIIELVWEWLLDEARHRSWHKNKLPWPYIPPAGNATNTFTNDKVITGLCLHNLFSVLPSFRRRSWHFFFIVNSIANSTGEGWEAPQIQMKKRTKAKTTNEGSFSPLGIFERYCWDRLQLRVVFVDYWFHTCGFRAQSRFLK